MEFLGNASKKTRPGLCSLSRCAASFTEQNGRFSVAQASACVVLNCGMGKSKEHRLNPVLHGARGTCAEQLRVLAQQKMIGHSGDVIAHDAMPGSAVSKLGVGFGHGFGMRDVKIE